MRQEIVGIVGGLRDILTMGAGQFVWWCAFAFMLAGAGELLAQSSETVVPGEAAAGNAASATDRVAELSVLFHTLDALIDELDGDIRDLEKETALRPSEQVTLDQYQSRRRELQAVRAKLETMLKQP